MKTAFIRYFLIALCLSLPAGVMADTTLTFSMGQGKSAQTSKMMISNGVVRVSGESRYMLYKADENAVYVVDPQSKSYMVMDRERIKKMGQRMQKSRERMRKMMKKLPEKQRKKMKKRMGGFLQETPKVTYSQTGGSAEVTGYSCQLGVIKRNGQKAVRLCTADPETLGMSDGDYGTLRKMYQFMDEMRSAFSNGSQIPSFSAIQGVPIRWKPLKGDSKAGVLQTVSHDDLPAQKLQVPSGYSLRASVKTR